MQLTSSIKNQEQNAPSFDYSELKLEDKLCGFTLEAIEDLPEIEGHAYKMRHIASGARLLFLHNADINKSFSISFKTPPEDDTGVFHILEHSVLNGSSKFPVKEPFVNLIKNSMQTFLNAMTFPDRTMYPVASTNTQDLLNLIDVYMDAVLHPAILHNPHIFEQEGWHTELVNDNCEDTQKDSSENPTNNQAQSTSELTYNGVVYNEMKGALSDPDSVLFDAVSANLFPDNAYRFESGGDPRFIPNLSYEKFIDTYCRHYRLDNSYIVLYGDLELEHFLEFLDKNYLEPDADLHKDSRGPNKLIEQAPIRVENKRIQMHTLPDNKCMALGYVAGNIHDRLRIHATDILLEALCGCNEAPLKRALLDADLGGEVVTHFQDGVLQPFIFLEIHGANDDTLDRFKSVVESEIRRLIDGGLDHEIIASALAHEEFQLRECNFGYADGVVFAISAMDGWLFDENMQTSYIRYIDMFKEMRDLLEGDYFERLLESLFLDNKHITSVILEPTDNELLGSADERLLEKEKSITTEEVTEILERMNTLREEQQRNDTAEQLATLPHLGIKDIEEAPLEEPPSMEDTKFGEVLRHRLSTRGIVYVNCYYDLSGLSLEDISYASLATLMMTCLDTKFHTASELVPLLQSNLGTLEYTFTIVQSPDDPMRIWPKLNASSSALGQNASCMARLVNEISLTTLFEDTARIKNILEQKKIGMEQGFAMQGNKAATRRAAASQNASAALLEHIEGVNFYQFICSLLENFEERKSELSTKLASVTRSIFTETECLVSFTGSDSELEAYMESNEKSLSDLLNVMDEIPTVNQSGLELELNSEVSEAFEVPADVTFTGIALDLRKQKYSDFNYQGSWPVICRALTYDYLWNEVRVKGGAYGVAFILPFTGASRFASFRDPHLDETIERFENAGSWLNAFSPSAEEWEGFVVSTVAGLDAPVKPRALIKRQVGYFIAGVDPSIRSRTRQEVIECTETDIRAASDMIDQVAKKGTRCVFGNADTIESSSYDWKITKLIK